MWKELKSEHEFPEVRFDKRISKWCVYLEKKNSGSTSWFFSTEEDAKQALNIARNLLMAGIKFHTDYKIMHRVFTPRKSK